jgi:hypothetical protein
MRRVGLAIVLVCVVLLGYWASPFLALRGMAADVQARNGPSLSERIDFARLRRSLAEQIVATYLRVTGRAGRLGPFANVAAAGLGASVADPILSKVINAENLIKLLGNESVPTDVGEVSLHFGPLSAWLESGWRAWRNSEYGFGHFSVGLPLNVATADQFRLRMQILRWRWKLTGLDLPEKVQVRLAQELAKRYP